MRVQRYPMKLNLRHDGDRICDSDCASVVQNHAKTEDDDQGRERALPEGDSGSAERAPGA